MAPENFLVLAVVATLMGLVTGGAAAMMANLLAFAFVLSFAYMLVMQEPASTEPRSSGRMPPQQPV